MGLDDMRQFEIETLSESFFTAAAILALCCGPVPGDVEMIEIASAIARRREQLDR